jgi:hypothetical protein
MRPSNDDEEFLHSVIREGSQHTSSFEHDTPRMTAANILTILAMATLSN